MSVEKTEENAMKIRALLAMVLCAMGLVFVTGCDSPEKGFNEWKEAVSKGDVAKARSLSVPNSDGEYILVDFWCEHSKEDPKEYGNAKVIDYEKDGDRALLKLKLGTGDTQEIIMVKDNGKWKFHSVVVRI